LILFLIVLYNETYNNSDTVKSIKEYLNNSSETKNEVKFVVFDNSDKEQYYELNQKQVSDNNWEYISLKQNIGLSKAYNYVISRYEFNWICLLDQDSRLSINFIPETIKSVSLNSRVLLHVPKVYADNKVISPAILKKLKVKSSIDYEIPIEKMTAINSGMVINKKVFSNIGLYNERIFLDLVDHNFIMNFRSNFSSYILMENSIKQDFSEVTNSKESSFARLKIYKKDLKEYCKKFKFGYLYYLSFLLYKIVKQNIKHKTLIFVNLLFVR
jgi:rhamnosyltransferase